MVHLDSQNTDADIFDLKTSVITSHQGLSTEQTKQREQSDYMPMPAAPSEHKREANRLQPLAPTTQRCSTSHGGYRHDKSMGYLFGKLRQSVNHDGNYITLTSSESSHQSSDNFGFKKKRPRNLRF